MRSINFQLGSKQKLINTKRQYNNLDFVFEKAMSLIIIHIELTKAK